MARILFVHTNFPAQFRFLTEALVARGHACRAISSSTGRPLAGVPLIRWSLGRGTAPGIFGPATRAEADILRGTACAKAAAAMLAEGFVPDLVIGHPGWGETLFLRDVFPNARQILYGEFFYRAAGADVGFDPEFALPDLDEAIRVRAKNATGLLSYAEADAIVAPTAFQASLFPAAMRDTIRVIHEGIDTEAIRPPDPPRPIRLADGTELRPSDPIVTFVNRRFEPMRGFHSFMRALPRFQAAVPEGRAVLIGQDEPGGYGAPAGEGTSWKARLLAELEGRLDLSRIHFTGAVPHAHFLALLGLGRAHVYLTYPFALSWSFLEAMALGCLIIGSANPPVSEVIAPGRNGLLVDMLDPTALADAMIDACRRSLAEAASLREAARRTVVTTYDRAGICLPAWLALVDEVLVA